MRTSGPVSCYADAGFSCDLPCDAPEHATGCLERYRNDTAESARCSEGSWECTIVDVASEPVGCSNGGELNCGMPCEPPEDMQTCWSYLESGTAAAEECDTGGCSSLSLDGFFTLAECIDGLWECTPGWVPNGRLCESADSNCVVPSCDTAGDRDFSDACERLAGCFESYCSISGPDFEGALRCDSRSCDELLASGALGVEAPASVDLELELSPPSDLPLWGSQTDEWRRLAHAAYKVFRGGYVDGGR